MYIPIAYGSGKIYAVIGVTYPAGSTCSATLDGRTLRAPDTSGQWACAVPGPGVWTVSCTDGDKSKAVTVEITAPGQVELAALSYELVLFDDGTYAPETGGWNKTGKTLKLSASTTQMSGASDHAYTNKPVDLASYSTLHFVLASNTSSPERERNLGVSRTQTGSFTAKASIKNGTPHGEHSLDISGIKETMYIQLYCQAWPEQNGQSATTTMEISKIWLT